MLTIHVLAGRELFFAVLNAVSVFIKSNSFTGLLKITSLAGIIMATSGFVKTRDPMIFAKWFFGYALFVNLALLPKTKVLINDVSAQNPLIVANVPVVFALPASLMTTIGYGLAQSYDELLSLPDDLLYTKTGSLFGARLITAARNFHIINPELRNDLDNYFRNCVVGDIKLNQKYSVNDLAQSQNIWQLISQHASPLRMVKINNDFISCQEASKADGILQKKLRNEIKNSYNFFGVNLFGKPHKTTYEALFATHLTSAFAYYQNLTDSASNIMLQAMMINAMGDGIHNYQAFTDSTAAVVNQQFAKSQVQHRWSWQIAGLKALWFLPLLHTILTLLLFGVFPLIMAAATLPNGTRLLIGYMQFFLSLQFWPVLFAILNAAMTIYGSSRSQYFGHITMMNLDQIDELQQDLSGVAGYIMLLIPFLANGLVSNLGAAFNGLATSMSSHLQGSAMGLAGEAAGASFSLGQTSFYNTSANNFSANKHDSNWTHAHGMRSEQLSSGVLKTITPKGEAIFDVSPAMTKSPVHIADSNALNGSLTKAYEESKQSLLNESQHYQASLSEFSHKAIQLSKLKGHDLRLGEGVSSQESSQYTQALATMNHIATDTAQRMGISTEEAMQGLIGSSFGIHASIATNRGILGTIANVTLGAQGSIDGNIHASKNFTSQDRFHNGTDNTISSRHAKDFNNAFNVVQNFVKNHHFDESHSQGANLSKQMGADLRNAETASHNLDASLSKSERIHQAQNYVQSHSSNITTDLNQAFTEYVAKKVGSHQRDALFANPGDLNSLQQLQTLGDEFISIQRDKIIANYEPQNHNLNASYKDHKHTIEQYQNSIKSNFNDSSQKIQKQSASHSLSIAKNAASDFKNKVNSKIHIDQKNLREAGNISKIVEDNQQHALDEIAASNPNKKEKK